MFCPNCGTQCPDDSRFCPSCGTTFVAAQPNNQPNYNQQNYNQPNYNQPNYNQPNYNQPVGTYSVHPMNWYKFLIYFSLFAGAVLNLILSIMYMTGSVYSSQDVSADLVYMFYPEIKPINIIYGIALILMAVFMVATRFSLSSYKKNAPNLLLGCYALGAVISLIYAILVGIIIEDMSTTGTVIASLVVSVIMIIVNKIYFDKRKDLFVN